jgi:hypothetical protein
MRGAGVRFANSLLRSVGGRTVLLRMPAPAVAGDLGEQLGLATPQFQDTPLSPAAFRKLRAAVKPEGATYELLVSASAVHAVVGSLSYDSAEVLFSNAAGILLEGDLLEITSAAAAEAFGEVYLYRLGLRSTAASVL